MPRHDVPVVHRDTISSTCDDVLFAEESPDEEDGMLPETPLLGYLLT